MAPAALELVRRPSQFFASTAARPSLLGPSLVALALGATAVVRLLVLLRVLGDVVEGFQGNPIIYAIGRLNVSAPRELVVASALVVLVFFLGWVLAAATTYAVSRYFTRGGSFRDLVALVGWGQMPILLPALVSTAYLLTAAQAAPEVTTEAAARTWMESWFLDSTVRQVQTVLAVAAAAWSSYLWLLATERALDLSRWQALLSVALPAALQILNAAGGFFAITP